MDIKAGNTITGSSDATIDNLVDINGAAGGISKGPYMSDGRHPNSAGYSIIAHKWFLQSSMGSEGGIMRHAILFMFSIFLLSYSQDYRSDSIAVRDILDANGMQFMPVEHVTATQNGRIVLLDMTRIADLIIDTMPPTLCQLTALETIILGFSPIDGIGAMFPECIGVLDSLKFLDLSYTYILSLPNSIGNLKNLKHLDLTRTILSELPATIGGCTKLQFLKVQGGTIKYFPSSFCNLANLCTLSVRFIGLETLPDSIGNLQNLHSIDLMGNHLTALPLGITNLNPDYVGVRGNYLCSVPPLVESWLDAHDSLWRDYQFHCTKISRPFLYPSVPNPLQPDSPINLYDFQGRLLGMLPFARVNGRLSRMSSGVYLLVLPERKGVVKAVVTGR